MAENFEQLCVALIASILGVAYPILLQVISNLDEKYKSQLITEFFKRDLLFKFFKLSLYISIFSIFVWIIGFKPNEFFEKILSILFLEKYIGDTAAYMLVFSTIILLISFFLFTSKVIIYYTPYKFLGYLIDKHHENPSFNEYEKFIAISDLFYYTIICNNEKMENTLNNFMYEEFKKIREENADGAIFPKSYYDLIDNIIKLLAQKEFNHLKSVEYRAASGIWLLGEYSKSKISEQTYYRLWKNLNTCVFYKKDDYILYYWEQANQYFNYSISNINPIYSNTTFLPENELEIEEMRKVRKKFKEFNYALGGLLLYSKRIECIKRIFEYTQSIPPVHELLPLDMTEVFTLYNNFIDPYDRNHLNINSLYPFPNTDGINSEKIIKEWICEYIALLFLRQYTIVPYLITMKPLAFPIFPIKLSERRIWIQHIDIFKQAVIRQLNNSLIVDTFGLGFLTHEYCSINNIDHPIDYFDKLKSQMEKSFQTILYEQELSKEKVSQLKETTTDILLNVFEKYEKINNHKKSAELTCYDFGTISHILEKNGFAENQEADYLNADSIVAENFISNYCDFISKTFVLAKSKSYVLSIEDLIIGVEKLEINPMEVVIISFGIKNNDFKKNKNLNKVTFIYFDKYDYNFVGESLFILNKKDLPNLDYKELAHDKINEFQYEKIIDDFNVYLSMLDLNKHDNKRKALQNTQRQEDLKKSVFISICINLSICWIKNVHMVQIKLATPFNEKGIKNSLMDILRFE